MAAPEGIPSDAVEELAVEGHPDGLPRRGQDRMDAHNPGALNNLGVFYASRGMHADAVDAFLRALALDPQLRTAMRNLEVAAMHPGACDAQLAELTARLDADPSDRRARRDRARLERMIGHVVDAIHLLDRLIAEDPEDADSLFERGLADQTLGDLKRAEHCFTRAVAAGAGAEARLHLAEVLYQRGQNEQALEQVERQLRLAPEHADAHRLRAFILGDLGLAEEAMAAAARAAELRPALEVLESHLSLDGTPMPTPAALMTVPPEGHMVHYQLGLALRQRGYFAEARLEFDRADAQGEDPMMVQHALAELDLLDGAAASARHRLEALLLETDSCRLWNDYGVALHQAGDLERAADGYRRALRADPRYALAYNNLGVSLAERHDWPSAREAFLRACTLDASAGIPRRNLALTHLREGEPLAALAVLRELVAFHAEDAHAWMLLRDVYRRLNRAEDAQEAHQQALATPPHLMARGHEHLAVAIELQRECPVSVGPVDLLRFAAPRVHPALPDPLAQTARAEAPRERTVGEARSMVLLGRAAEALPLVRELAREAPDDPELLLLYAAAIIDERGFPGTQAAQLALTRLYGLTVESAGLLHFAGDIAMRIENEQLAMGFYRRALAMDPTRPTPRVAVARVLRRRGDLLAARLELVAALARAPYWSDAVTELARLHLALAQPAAARLSLVTYLQQAPTDLPALALLVESLVAEDRLLDARVALDRLLQQDPAHPAGLWFDGVLLAAQSRERDAATRWVRLAMDPEGEPWSRLAREALTKAMLHAGAASPRRRRPSIIRGEAVA